MQTLRSLLCGHRWLATLIVVAALCVRAVVPAGFMVGTEGAAASRHITIQICTGGEMRAMTIALPSHNAAGGEKSAKTSHDETCAFTALSMGALGGVDLVLLALALAFALLLGFLPVRVVELAASFHLRPPLRGPPLSA